MPNRLIREGWLDSEAIDKLSSDAERFFLRLCLAADDAGRFDGRRDILRSRLFPLKFGLRSSDVEKLLKQCVDERLVMPYEWDQKPFLQLVKCQRCSPCVVSKFPDRDGSHKIVYVKRETRDGEKEFVLSSLIEGMGKGCQRDTIPLETDPSKCTESGTESGTESSPPIPPRGFEEFWKAYPKKKARGNAEKAWKKIEKPVQTLELILRAIEAQKKGEQWRKDGGQFIPHPATWLNAKGWLDEDSAIKIYDKYQTQDPDWKPVFREIVDLLHEAPLDAEGLRDLGSRLPKEAWTAFTGQEYNILSRIMKEAA